MSIFDWGTTTAEEPTPSKSSGSIFNWETPTVQKAVDSLPETLPVAPQKTGIFDSIGNAINKFNKFAMDSFMPPAVKTAVDSLPPTAKSMEFPIISSPLTDTTANKLVDDLNVRGDSLLQKSKTLDLTNPDAVDSYNSEVEQFQKDSADASPQIDQFNMAQKAHQVLTTPTGREELGLSQEHQFEKGVGIVLLAGGLLAGGAEGAIALDAGAQLVPMLSKALLQGTVGLGVFKALDLATAGIKENASDKTRMLIFLGELFAAGGILHGLNKTVPKIGDKLFQTYTEKYNAPKTIYFKGDEIPQKIATVPNSPEHKALIEALSKDGHVDKAKASDAMKNGITIEVPASVIKNVAEKPIWTKVKKAFGVESGASENTNVLGEGKRAPQEHNLLEAPSKEDLQKLAQEVSFKVKAPEEKISPELKPLAEEAKKYKSAEEFIGGLNELKSSDKNFEILPNSYLKTPKKLYRGESAMTGLGTGSGAEGFGLYTTTDKNIAQGYAKLSETGVVKEMSLNDIPKNPIYFRGPAEARDWATRIAKQKFGMKLPEFNEKIGINKLVNYLGHDGIAFDLGNGVAYAKYPEQGLTKSQLTDFYNKVHGLDSEGKPLENGEHGRLPENFKRAGRVTGESEGGTRRNDDNTIFTRAVSENGQGDGIAPSGTHTDIAKELDSRNPVEVKGPVFEVLKSAGFSDAFVSKLKDVHLKGGVKNIVATPTITKADGTVVKIEGMYSNNTFYFNPTLSKTENFINGDILNHELNGHSWYAKLSPDGRKTFYENLKTNRDILKQSWEKINLEHQFYWKETVDEIERQIGLFSSKEMASSLIDFFDLKFDPDISLDTFINKSLNLDKTIEAINTELVRRGQQTIPLTAENTSAIREHVGVIAENSSKLTANDTSIIGRYIGDIQSETLKFGENGLNNLIYPGETDLSIKTLEKLKGRDFVSKQFISDMTNSGDIKQVERDILRDVLAQYPDDAKIPIKDFAEKVKVELLPLEVRTSYGKISAGETGEGNKFSAKYEFVNLPAELRGDVKDYREHIYNSSIKTSAGDIHFSNNGIGQGGISYESDGRYGIRNSDGDVQDIFDTEEEANDALNEIRKNAPGSGGYFGHTRIEDMADDNTRRVIEVQSDLYQKGNLEREGIKYAGKTEEEIKALLKESNPEQTYSDGAIKTFQEMGNKVEKLSQYNDPTAHFRMVREEIKKAAEDGKTKLQFPTGETAMKIEGLGQEENNWYYPRDYSQVTAEDIGTLFQVGDPIIQGTETWIITDILGNGKFKAVQKKYLDDMEAKKRGEIKTFNEENLDKVGTPEGDKKYLDALKESFDISGKVDTQNPIYRFYEKDLGRYLKNQYDAKPVTDENGVTWNEVDIKPAMAEQPVMAFRVSGDNEEIARLREEQQRVQGFLDVAVSNQDQSIFKNKIPALKAELSQIKQKISDLKFPKAETGREALANIEKRTGVKPVDIPKIQNQLSRVQLSLNAAKEAPEAHKKAYGEDRVPQYEAKIEELQTKLNEAIKAPEFPKAPKIRVSNKEIELPEDLYHRQLSVELKRQELEDSPFEKLLKYVAKSGEFEGHLPEVLGKSAADLKGTKAYGRIRNENVLKFIQKGDEIIQEVFGAGETYGTAPDTETVTKNMDKYIQARKDLIAERKQINAEVKQFITAEKDRIAIEKIAKMGDQAQERERTKEQIVSEKIKEAESLADWKNFVATYAEEINAPKSLEDVKPPIGRGGISSPVLNLGKANDRGWMARDSIDRNIEKTFTREDAVKLNEFLSDKFRENATKEVEYLDAKFKPLEDEMKKLGIKPGSDESAFVQLYGEGLITIDNLMKEFPKTYKNIQAAVPFYKRMYEIVLHEANIERKKFGYDPILPLQNYFPHFDAISFWTKNYGILNKNDDLPTAIAGKTQFFKPGKTFTRHELHRTGRKTEYDAIAGAKEYVRSMAKQMFSMDNLARARAVDRYITKSDEVGQRLGTPLHLSRFQTNLQEVIQNQLASKMGSLDREGEKFGDRKVVNMVLTASKLVGKNIIAFNPATMMTHTVSMTLNAATVDKIDFVKGLMTTVSVPFSKEPYWMIDGQRSDLLFRRYPREYLKTKFESVEAAGGWMIKQSDIFKTRTAVASKYYELVKQGVDPKVAIKQADIYAGRIVGDYSRGLKPILLNQKFMKLIAQFQFGMNDGISVLMHDIPYQTKKMDGKTIKLYKGKDGVYREKKDYIKMFWKYAQWAVYAYLLNEVLTQIKGSGKGLDPIGLALTLAGASEEGRGQTVGTRVKKAGTELLGELPFTNVFTGNSPTASAFSKPFADLIAGNLLKGGLGLAEMFVSPVGGGLQVKKTYTGIQAYRKGYVENAAGVPQFPVKKGVGSAIQSALFGPSGNPTAQSFYNTKGAVNPMKATYDEVQQLIADGKQDEAQKIVDALSDEEYKKYTAVRTAAKTATTKAAEIAAIPQTQVILNLIKAGKNDEAQKIVDAMSDDQYKYYQGAKKMITTASTKTENTFGGGSSEWEKQSFMTHVVNIAKAATLHPIEYFNNIFDGAGDWRVTGVRGNQILVNRMSLTASETAKRAAGKDTSEWKLDHIWPLEAGGNNSADNLQLIPTEQWSTNTAVENLIAAKLASGSLSGAKAKEFSIRYKAGQGEILSPVYMDLYNKKYKSVPITADEIANYEK